MIRLLGKLDAKTVNDLNSRDQPEKSEKPVQARFRPLSFRMMSRADLMRLPRCWAVVWGWSGFLGCLGIDLPSMFVS